MVRSMFAAVSGLRNHQIMMDVIASNISNVNTFGYKSERATFKDSLYQNLSGAAAPIPPSLGGTNPMQVGLGMTINSIDTLTTQGNAQNSGVVTDMMVQGDGYFRIAANGATFGGAGGDDLTAGGELYTRAGNFSFDSAGHLAAHAHLLERLVGADAGAAGLQRVENCILVIPNTGNRTETGDDNTTHVRLLEIVS